MVGAAQGLEELDGGARARIPGRTVAAGRVEAAGAAAVGDRNGRDVGGRGRRRGRGKRLSRTAPHRKEDARALHTDLHVRVMVLGVTPQGMPKGSAGVAEPRGVPNGRIGEDMSVAAVVVVMMDEQDQRRLRRH